MPVTKCLLCHMVLQFRGARLGHVGKNILITGASRGLGRELSRHFWDTGANVVLVAKNEGNLRSVLNGLAVRHRQQATYIPADLADQDCLHSLVEDLKETRIDAVINNAAIQGPIGPLHDNPWGDWCKAVEINLLAPVFLCRAFVHQMRQRGGGSIVNLSGGGATGPRPNFTAYATAKAGLVRFSETLAEELRGTGVRVNCVAPGPLATHMMGQIVEAGADQAGPAEYETAERILEQSESHFAKVAELCSWLIDDRSEPITGKLISAIWDPWDESETDLGKFAASDVATLRRIVPEDRNCSWDNLTCDM